MTDPEMGESSLRAQPEPFSIDLIGGYREPKSGVVHKHVTFGKILTGKELFIIDDDPQSNLPSQYQDLLLSRAITKFGTLVTPVSLIVFQRLDSIDRDDLSDAYETFSRQWLAGRKAEYPSDRVVKLSVGYQVNGMTYDLVEFGNRLVGMDEVRADKLGHRAGTIRRVCYLIGRQVSKLSCSEGVGEIDGPLPMGIFEQLDGVDIQALRVGAELWRQSFRRPGAGVSGLGPRENNAAAGETNGMVGSGDPGTVH